MTTKFDLDMIDRATLSAWRAWNTLKWSVAGLAVAYAVASGFYLALPDFTINLSSRVGIFEATLLMLVPSVMGAIAIGVIVGRHVIRRPFLIAGIVALVHMISSVWFALRDLSVSPTGYFFIYAPTGGRPEGEGLLMVLVVVAEVYIAGVIAARTWAKRPRALRAQP
jgi:hypothetical protein